MLDEATIEERPATPFDPDPDRAAQLAETMRAAHIERDLDNEPYRATLARCLAVFSCRRLSIEDRRFLEVEMQQPCPECAERRGRLKRIALAIGWRKNPT